MRLPWIQLTEDGDRRARSFGKLLGIGGDAGVGFVTRVWRAALDLSPPGDFSGAFDDPELLVAHAGGNPEGFTGEPLGVVKILQRVGLTAANPTLRVRGLDRYKATWVNNRKRPNKQDHPKGVLPEPARKTETETETEKNNVAKRDRKPSAAEDFFGWLNATRETVKTLPPQTRPGVARLNKTFGEALTTCGRAELEGRYRAYLADSTNSEKDPPWPWQVFAASWSWRKAQAPASAKFITTEQAKGLYADT